MLFKTNVMADYQEMNIRQSAEIPQYFFLITLGFRGSLDTSGSPLHAPIALNPILEASRTLSWCFWFPELVIKKDTVSRSWRLAAGAVCVRAVPALWI